MADDSAPLFLQVARDLEMQIVDGALAEGDKVPSGNEYAAFYRINPATAAKGINTLVDAGLLEKRRGIGMFVTVGAREQVLQRRRQEFAAEFIRPLLVEAQRLDVDIDTLIRMIREGEAS